MIERHDQEPCHCGDPDCQNCFPCNVGAVPPEDGDEIPTLSEALVDIATPDADEIWNPAWITPKMKLTTAAKEANDRGYYLKAYWDQQSGMMIKAVKK